MLEKISTQVCDKYYRYNHSPKGLKRGREYDAKRGSRAVYVREFRHRIQDEAGCHRNIETFYPLFTFLKALEEAEVVEI